MRKPDEDAQANSAEVWTYLEWETALQVTARLIEAFLHERMYSYDSIAPFSHPLGDAYPDRAQYLGANPSSRLYSMIQSPVSDKLAG